MGAPGHPPLAPNVCLARRFPGCLGLASAEARRALRNLFLLGLSANTAKAKSRETGAVRWLFLSLATCHCEFVWLQNPPKPFQESQGTNTFPSLAFARDGSLRSPRPPGRRRGRARHLSARPICPPNRFREGVRARRGLQMSQIKMLCRGCNYLSFLFFFLIANFTILIYSSAAFGVDV